MPAQDHQYSGPGFLRTDIDYKKLLESITTAGETYGFAGIWSNPASLEPCDVCTAKRILGEQRQLVHVNCL